jgi:HK97 family phage major capsid protein
MPDELTLDGLRGQNGEQLRAIVSRLDADLADLHIDGDGELRDLDGAEQRRWDRLSNLRSRAEARLREHDRGMAAFRSGRGIEVAYGNLAPSGDTRGGPVAGAVTRARQFIDSRFRDRALPDYAAERAESLLADSAPGALGVAAEYILAAGDSAYEAAFAKSVADPVRGHMMWTEPERTAYQRVAELRTAMGTGTGVGGDMVPLTLDPALMLTSAGSNNPLRQICRVVQTVSNTWQGVSTSGATAEWKAEQAQAADGSPPTTPKPIPVYFADVDVVFSYELGMDAISFMPELSRVMQDAVNQLTNLAYTTGPGTTQPKGFVPNATAPARTAGVFTVADVYLLQNSLPPRFSANAHWCANIAVMNAIAQFQIGTTQYAFPEIREDPPRLLTKPVHEVSNMSGDMTTAASRFLAYGDFQQHVIVDRIGSFLEVLPGYGAGFRPTGQRHAFLYFRTGSDLVIPTAVQVIAKS